MSRSRSSSILRSLAALRQLGMTVWIGTRCRLTKIVRLAPDELRMRQRPDLSRFHEDDIVRVLHFPFDEQKRLLRNHEADALKQIRRHNRIRHPGLILQADEDKSLRRPGR